MIMRLYSHLKPSVISEKWEPHGMPAFCKLVEGLNRKDIDTEVLLFSRLPSEDFKSPKKINFQKLKNVEFSAFPFNGWLKDWFRVRKQIKQKQYDVIYVDRIHVVFGALLAILGYKVVLRLHGVANLLELPFLRKGFVPSLQLMSYKAPFTYVVGSQDGSPVKAFINKYLSKKVPVKIFYNGVDCKRNSDGGEIRKKYNISENSTVFISTGRLDPTKSMDIIVETFIALLNEGKDLTGFIIGGGEEYERLQSMVKDAGYENKIILPGQIPHNEINDYLDAADVFISLNLFGNLSNCVLEAMTAHKCIITLKPCKITSRDEQNNSENMQNALILIDRNNIKEELSNSILHLLEQPEEIKAKSKAVAEFTDNNITDWNTRIDKEIEILSTVAEK